jgi:hypothetical protein
MSTIFAITTTTNTIRLTDNRPGEIIYTVSNTGNRPLRGRARLVLPANTPADWFTITGPAERDFAPAATQQYTVQATPGATTAGGRYLLRLDMIGVQNPDEEFAEGPTVTVEIAPAQPVAKAFPWWIVAVGLGGLFLLAVLAFILIRLLGGAGEPITTLADILEVMAIEDLETDRPLYNAGDTVLFTYNLTNSSRSPVIPDSNNTFNQPLVGVRQHWIERLGNDATIPGISANAARDGNRFAIGGSIIPVQGELAPGDQISFSEQLATNALFPAGDYRISVEYRDLAGTVIQTETVDFEIR